MKSSSAASGSTWTPSSSAGVRSSPFGPSTQVRPSHRAPPERAVEPRRAAAGGQRAQLVRPREHVADRLHHRAAVAPAAPVAAHGNRLDVARPQRATVVDQRPPDDGGMCHERSGFRAERVHASQGVLPVAVAERAVVRAVEEAAQLGEGGGVERGRGCGVDGEHAAMLPGRLPPAVREWATCPRP